MHESRKRQFGRAGATADGGIAFNQQNGLSRAREGDGRGQPVWSRPHHDGVISGHCFIIVIDFLISRTMIDAARVAVAAR